jgi:hypothetical protein
MHNLQLFAVRSLVLFLGLFTLAPLMTAQQASTPAGDVQQLVERSVKATRLFLEGHTEKPGVSTELREISRDHVQGKLVVRYRAFARGVDTSTTYSAYTWPINAREPQPVVQGITFGKDGVALCAGRTPNQCGSHDKPDDPVDFALLPAPGEPFRLALIADDKSNTLMFGVVPEPIAQSDRGCTLEAIRLLPKWELVMVRAKGLQPNQPLRFKSDSAGEIQENEGKSDPNGNYISAVLPFVNGKSTGSTNVRVTTPTCSPAIGFDWGKQ